MVSERTKSLKKKRSLFGILTYGLWLGVAIFLAVFAFVKVGGSKEVAEEGMQILSPEMKDALIGLGTTVGVAAIGAIIIKDKIRTFVWMISLIISIILFDKVGMYVVLAVWLVDEYILNSLFKHYCHLVEINKEIDLR